MDSILGRRNQIIAKNIRKISNLHTKSIKFKFNYNKIMSTIQEKIYAAQTAHEIPPGKVQFPHKSIAELLTAQAEKFRNNPFMIYYDENNHRSETTYYEFYEAVRRTAAFMLELGLKRGDRIATAAHNHPDTIIQCFASWAIGVCVVPLNMSEDDERLRFILENSEVKLIFCREEYASRVTRILPQSLPQVVHIFDNVSIPQGFHQHILHHQSAVLSYNDALDDECLIVYTSGTTGQPRGVVLVQRNLMADGYSIAQWHKMDHNQKVMCVLPIHHVNGMIVTNVAPMIAGATVVLNRKFQTDQFFTRIRAEHVNIVSVVPTLLAFLLQAKAPSLGVKKTSLKHIICGAGPLTCELAKLFEATYKVPIIHGYGLSETTCYSCFLPLDMGHEEHRHWMEDFGFPSIGIQIPHNEMAIHDENGIALGEMERGEIVIRGSNVMKEYFKNAEANEKAFEFGWFRSGDEGFFKQDDKGRNFFFITGRLKELIIRGGVNIAPLEIDEVIAKAPGVKQGICVGFENNFYGEEVGALVIPQDINTGKEEILEYCANNLPFHKTPKVILFCDELPITTTGKYQRNRVKHLFAEWKSAQFRKSF